MNTPGRCRNCGAALSGPYCAQCGQKVPHTDLTLREFFRETTHELTHWDGKVPQTLLTLFWRPGLLTLDFFAGRRARWLPPFRVYLICSIAYFVSGPVVERLTHRSFRELARITITNPRGDSTLTPEERLQVEAGLPARLFGMKRLERAAANPAQLNRAIKSAFPKAMFVLLPLFALLTNLAWRRRAPRYPAHLYLALHVHAAWFGALALATVATAVFPSDRIAIGIGLAGLIYLVWYGLVAVRRVFGDSWAMTLAKSAGITVLYAASLFVASMGLLAYALATM